MLPSFLQPSWLFLTATCTRSMVFDIVDVLNLDPEEVEFVVVIPDR